MRPSQGKVIERLERETMTSIRKLTERGSSAIQILWDVARRQLQDEIARAYRADFRSSTWNIVMAARQGTLQRIDQAAKHVLDTFKTTSMTAVSRNLKEIYREGVYRNAWILDQVTPPSRPARIPFSPVLREAVSVYLGPDADTTWKVRWDAWMDEYRKSLVGNLRLGAINESSVDDAMDEVDATRPGSPRAGLLSALDRVYSHQAEVVYGMAQKDVVEANPDYDITEIWQTRYYLRVCDDCNDNAGLTRNEADGDIPLHPNCGCYWRLVPAAWADLMRTGNMDDREIAKRMDADGVVPTSMAVFNDSGKLVGHVTVSFDEWSESQAKVIQTR